MTILTYKCKECGRQDHMEFATPGAPRSVPCDCKRDAVKTLRLTGGCEVCGDAVEANPGVEVCDPCEATGGR
jgi:transposase-like protein